MKNVVILGSTGSIGRQALQVIEQFPEVFRITGLAAGNNIDLLAKQIQKFQPQHISVATAEGLTQLQLTLQHQGRTVSQSIQFGPQGLDAMVTSPEVDIVIVGLVGFLGLQPTLKALEAGKRVLTANKETFVTAGHLVKPYINQIVPIDSEHSAIFQCLQSSQQVCREVKKIYLTASGGPFRGTTREALEVVTPQQALKHPNWSMGDRITIDSATLMNKGLEVIEAHALFNMDFSKIEVVIHPQSIIHSAVQFVDNSVIAQLGQPSMLVPIQYALSYPERWEMAFEETELNLMEMGNITFEPPDTERFPCLNLARAAGETGGTMPAVLNASDEMAVAAFLNGEIGFMDIPKSIERLMQAHQPDWEAEPSLEQIQTADQWTRAAWPQMKTITHAPSAIFA